MPTTTAATPVAWTRAAIDQLEGGVLLEFGAGWCGWCQQAQPWIAAALAKQPALRHIRIEDGRGQPLGRSFGVKLWPTLVLMRDGREVARLVRPSGVGAIDEAMQQLGDTPKGH